MPLPCRFVKPLHVRQDFILLLTGATGQESKLRAWQAAQRSELNLRFDFRQAAHFEGARLARPFEEQATVIEQIVHLKEVVPDLHGQPPRQVESLHLLSDNDAGL